MLAETGIGEITAGLGVIAAALLVGQYLVYKFIYGPMLVRADTALQQEITRGAQALADERERCDALTAAANERADRMEAEVKVQNQVLQDKALPAMIAATTAVSESQALLRELKRDKEVTEAALELERRRAGSIRTRRTDGESADADIERRG